METLIEVCLTNDDRASMQERGMIRLYGFSWIDPEIPRPGRSVLPPHLECLFCDESERPKFPQLYELTIDEDDFLNTSGKWRYTPAGWSELCKAYGLRYTSDYWTISDEGYLYVFPNQENCLKFLQSRKSFHGYVARAPGGSPRSIEIKIELTEPA